MLTYDSENNVFLFFMLGALTGFSSDVTGLIKHDISEQLTPHITAAFLMSICGNCNRILAKSEAFLSEKIILSTAVLSYSSALFCDLRAILVVAIYLKLITTGCVGLWNALQLIRLYINNSRFMEDIFQLSKAFETYAVLASFGCYSLGAILGYGTALLGIMNNLPCTSLSPFISFAFVMSHWGNLIRSEISKDAYFSEKMYIRIAVLVYSMALIFDFIDHPKTNNIAAYAKLTAAGCVGLWNAVQTWRLKKSSQVVEYSPQFFNHTFSNYGAVSTDIELAPTSVAAI